MFTVTNENLHIYVVSFIGLLIICFAVELYIKYCLDIELLNIKKRIKKIQLTHDMMIVDMKKRERVQIENDNADNADNDDCGNNDQDSYMDPLN